jgi:hypothetical protein
VKRPKHEHLVHAVVVPEEETEEGANGSDRVVAPLLPPVEICGVHLRYAYGDQHEERDEAQGVEQ